MEDELEVSDFDALGRDGDFAVGPASWRRVPSADRASLVGMTMMGTSMRTIWNLVGFA